MRGACKPTGTDRDKLFATRVLDGESIVRASGNRGKLFATRVLDGESIVRASGNRGKLFATRVEG